jgi:uncharacterized protein (DUF58 family)
MNTHSSTAIPSAGPFVDPQVLMRIRNLELRARVVVEGFWTGLHRSPYHGFSVEFTEYRPYIPGDDPRYLDWRVLGRSDRFFIKKFEDETNLRCHLLVDLSHSMSFGTRGYTKMQYAATLAATLAYFLQLQGDAVGLLTFDEKVRDFLPARHRPGHLRRLLLALEKATGGRSTNLSAPLQRVAEMVRKRGLMVVISDFLAPVDHLTRSLVPLTASGHEVMVFLIMDPAETEFAFDQASLFSDLESGERMYVDPLLARADYQRQLRTHSEFIQTSCQRLGISVRQLTTDQSLEWALFAFLQERTLRGRKAKSTRNTRSPS